MLALVLTYKFYAQVAVLLVTAAVALRRGAGPEKACSAVLVIVLWLGDLLNHALASSPNFNTVETGHLVLDSIGFALLLTVALYANRIYPLWMAVTQGMVVLTHFAEEAARSAPLAYSILSLAPSYLLLALLVGGLAAHIRRSARYGRYRSWRWRALPGTAEGSPAR